MTRDDATKLLALIKVAYPSSYKDMDRDFANATVNMWQSTFPNVPYEVMETAFNQFRKKSKFPPTVADMYEELKGLYYSALQTALTTKDTRTKASAMCIMKHTRTFMDGTEQELINYGAVTQLMGSDENRMMIEGD